MIIQIVNVCPDLVDHGTAQKWVDAIQRQILSDFAPLWDEWTKPATLHYAGDGAGAKPAPGDGVIKIVQHSGDVGALGSHWIDGTHPMGEAAVEDCIADGVAPSSCLDHECLEMNLDVQCVRCVQVGSQIWMLEACDRCESSDENYAIDGIALENFSTPAAFLDSSSGPWDFRKTLSSNVLAPAGYQLALDTGSAQWQQLTGMRARNAKRAARTGSRRASRIRRAGGDPSKLTLVAV